MKNQDVNPDWFNKNEDAIMIFRLFAEIAHVWDDLIDGDKVEPERINGVFKALLIDLPCNKLYADLAPEIYPILLTSIAAWHTANSYEVAKDEHGIEVAHGLRYALGHAMALVSIATCGYDNALKQMPEMWKFIMNERFEPYRKEILDGTDLV